jgi:diketogulonate reductase-like aldo/keto reductase
MHRSSACGVIDMSVDIVRQRDFCKEATMTQTEQQGPFTTSRRDLLGAAAAIGAVATASPGLGLTAGSAQAQDGATPTVSAEPPITRRIAGRDEALPVLGLGTFLTFDRIPGDRRDDLREVMRTYWQAGARVIDTSPLYGTGETSVGHFATTLGINEQIFIADKIWSTGDYLGDESHARRSLESSQRLLWRKQIDVMHVHSLVNVDMMLPYLRAWKKEGHIRFTGISHFETPYLPILTSLVEKGDLDFVQINYSIFNRHAEERLLPAAADQGVSVLTNMPFEKARLFKIVEGRPLPGFAREIGAENWAQFFLKYVVSHPAVTCALAATSNPSHAAENVGALRGALPDAEMRRRMVRYMEDIPGFDRIAEMKWYPDKLPQYQGVISRAQAALRARLA